MKTMKRLFLTWTVLILMLVSISVSVSAATYPESTHDYSNSMDETWTYTHDDTTVESLRITFSTSTKVESNYDYIYIYTSSGSLIDKYTGTELAGQTVEVPGNGFMIRLTSDGSYTYYGFSITNIEGIGGAGNIGDIGGSGYPESSHNYSAYTNQTWTYTHEDQTASYLGITFNSQTYCEWNYDNIYIYTSKGDLVGQYTGDQLAGETVFVDGASFTIQLITDGSFNYYGFKIDNISAYYPTDISSGTVTLSETSVTYNGLEQMPSVTVTCDGMTLVQDTDYTVSYRNNINAGTATVTVTGIGRYAGTQKSTFTIDPLPLSEVTAKLSKTSLPYTGSAQTPSVTVKHGDKTLTKGTDYTVSYSNNTKVGTAKAIITGKGNYTGKLARTFKIKKSLSKATITLSKTSVTYTGSARKPTVTVKYGDKTLKKDTDYTVKYSNNKKAGTASVTITGKGNYAGTVKKTFTIKKLSLSKAKITLSTTSVTYNGSARKPRVTVKYGDKTLTKDTDYTVTYSNNKNAGTATVKITGKGSCTGTVEKTFTIKKLSLSNVTISKISSQKYTGEAITPKITVKYGSKTLSSSNYKVKYSSNTKAGTATVTISAKGSNTTGSKKITFKIEPVISATKKNMYAGKTFTLKLKGVSSSKVEFSSSKTSVCTVNASGVVTAKKAGSAKIYAKYNGKTYTCEVKVLDTSSTTSSTSTIVYYKNHDDVPDFGALLKITPTKSTTSSSSGDTFLYSLSDLQKVDPDQEAGDKYKKLLVKCGFELKSSSVKIDGKYYYKYASEKKIVYFGIASKNGEVKIIIKKS